jgi:hypothetical protein
VLQHSSCFKLAKDASQFVPTIGLRRALALCCYSLSLLLILAFVLSTSSLFVDMTARCRPYLLVHKVLSAPEFSLSRQSKTQALLFSKSLQRTAFVFDNWPCP